eukprot:759688-Hanusia_phi.AAC.2
MIVKKQFFVVVFLVYINGVFPELFDIYGLKQNPFTGQSAVLDSSKSSLVFGSRGSGKTARLRMLDERRLTPTTTGFEKTLSIPCIYIQFTACFPGVAGGSLRCCVLGPYDQRVHEANWVQGDSKQLDFPNPTSMVEEEEFSRAFQVLVSIVFAIISIHSVLEAIFKCPMGVQTVASDNRQTTIAGLRSQTIPAIISNILQRANVLAVGYATRFQTLLSVSKRARDYIKFIYSRKFSISTAGLHAVADAMIQSIRVLPTIPHDETNLSTKFQCRRDNSRRDLLILALKKVGTHFSDHKLAKEMVDDWISASPGDPVSAPSPQMWGRGISIWIDGIDGITSLADNDSQSIGWRTKLQNGGENFGEQEIWSSEDSLHHFCKSIMHKEILSACRHNDLSCVEFVHLTSLFGLTGFGASFQALGRMI